MLTKGNVPVRNLKGNAGRTAALVLFSALMAMAVFGGTTLALGVQQGLDAMQKRLGADIIVTPADAASEFDAQTALVQAEPNYFYMDAAKLDEVAAVDGVEAASPQLFMASAKASCCSARLQLIGFDPATDFVIKPWIAESFGAQVGELGTFDVVVGCNVTVYDDHIIRFYDRDCHVVGQFAPTGSTLDNAVYMSFDTVKALIEASFEKRLNRYKEFDPDAVISSVMVKVAPDRDPAEVAAAINEGVEGVSVATSAGMVAGVADGLEGVSGMVSAFVVVFWVIGLVMTVLIFVMTVHARRREFATMRAVGASGKIVRGIVVREALLANLVGGAVGIVASAVVLYTFAGLVSSTVGAGFVMPGPATAALTAIAALASVVVAAVVSAAIAVWRVNKMDASLILKEGE